MHHPRTLITYNRIAGRKALFPLVLIMLLLGWPIFASAAGYNNSFSDSSLRTALLRHFDHWEGTPYRFGGNSHRGIDCSGFVHTIFRDALGIEVPRSTRLLSGIRKRVPFRSLRAGDIIIFRTSPRVLHAGIYVGKGQFIHASKSRGVMLSDFSNPYWTGVYEKSVRIIDRHI